MTLIDTVSYIAIITLIHLYWTPVFLLFDLLSARLLDPPNLLRRPQSLSTNTSLHPRQPVSSHTIPNVQVNPDLYHRELQYHSCADALFSIPQGDPIPGTVDNQWSTGMLACLIDG